MDVDSTTLARLGWVALAVAGLLVLVLSMNRFEQHRSGRVTTAIVGGMLLVVSVAGVVWDSPPS